MADSAPQNTGPETGPKAGMESAGFLERVGMSVDWSRSWVRRGWRIGVLMAKGAYLLGERRRLFVKLGEEVYQKILKGELQNTELEPLVRQLDRLTKKVEIEEILIRNLRFGTKTTRSSRPAAPPPETAHV